MPRFKLSAVRQAELSNRDFLSSERDAVYTMKTPRADEWYAKNVASVSARREKFFPQWFSKSPPERESQILRVEDGR
jgi:hypothetical protein